MIGGATIKLFFPERIGADISIPLLFVLVPIWTIGVVGILLSLLAWLMYPRMADELDLGLTHRRDGRFFGTFTRTLACVTLTLLCLGCAALTLSQDEPPLSLWLRLLILYVVVCASGRLRHDR